MIKGIITFGTLYIVFGFSGVFLNKKQTKHVFTNTCKDSVFTVRKIDSINDYYVVYLKKI